MAGSTGASARSASGPFSWSFAGDRGPDPASSPLTRIGTCAAVARCRCAGGTSLRAALFRQVKPLRCCRRTSLASASSDALALQSQLRRHMRLAEHQPGTKIGPALPWGALSTPLVGAACRTRAGRWTEPPHLPLGLFSHWTVTPREEAHLRFVYRPARCWVLALSRCSMTVSWTNGALFSPSSRSVGTRGPSSP